MKSIGWTVLRSFSLRKRAQNFAATLPHALKDGYRTISVWKTFKYNRGKKKRVYQVLTKLVCAYCQGTGLP